MAGYTAVYFYRHFMTYWIYQWCFSVLMSFLYKFSFYLLCLDFCTGTAVDIWVSWGKDWLTWPQTVEKISRAHSRDSGAASQQQVSDRVINVWLTCERVCDVMVILRVWFLFHVIFRYKSSQKVFNWSRLMKPIYLSNRGSKFSDWSATWAGYLISKVGSSPLFQRSTLLHPESPRSALCRWLAISRSL